MTDLHELFGQLRSKLNALPHERYPGFVRRDIQKLVESAWQHDPERYLAEWRPYLDAHPHALDVKTSLEHLDETCQWLPSRCSLTFEVHGASSATYARAEFTRLVEHPHLDRITHLHLCQTNVGQDALFPLFSRRLARLEHLTLSTCNLRKRWLAVMREHGDLFDTVTTLKLDGVYYPSDTLSILIELFESERLEALHTLDLQGTEYHKADLEALATCPIPPSLRHIDLTHTQLDDRGAFILSQASENLDESRVALDLSGNAINAAGRVALAIRGLFPAENLLDNHRQNLQRTRPEDARTLADCTLLARIDRACELDIDDYAYGSITDVLKSPHLSSIPHLTLRARHGMAKSLDDFSLRALRVMAHNSAFDSLHTLTLKEFTLEQTHLDALLDASWFSTLTELHLDTCLLDADAEYLSSLVAHRSFPDLETLRITSSKLTDAQLDPLLNGARHPNLQTLVLRTNQLAMSRVTMTPDSLPSLHTLDLCDNRIGPKGIRTLAWDNLPALSLLSLSSNRLKDEGFLALLEAKVPGKLERVELDGNTITANVMPTLLDDPHVEDIGTIGLTHVRDHMKAMESAHHIATVRALEELIERYIDQPHQLRWILPKQVHTLHKVWTHAPEFYAERAAPLIEAHAPELLVIHDVITFEQACDLMPTRTQLHMVLDNREHNDRTRVSISNLARLSAQPRFTHLYLSSLKGLKRDLQTLFGTLQFTHLEVLQISHCDLGASLQNTLHEAPMLHTVRELSITESGSNTLSALCGSDIDYPHLRRLKLDPVEDHHLDALGRAPWLERLEVLELCSNQKLLASRLRDTLSRFTGTLYCSSWVAHSVTNWIAVHDLFGITSRRTSSPFTHITPHAFGGPDAATFTTQTKLDELTLLELSTCTPQPPPDAPIDEITAHWRAFLRAIFAREHIHTLRLDFHHIASPPHGKDEAIMIVLEELLGSPLLARLDNLDLPEHELHKDTIGWLLTHQHDFAHLERMGLALKRSDFLSNYFYTRDTYEKIKASSLPLIEWRLDEAIKYAPR